MDFAAAFFVVFAAGASEAFFAGAFLAAGASADFFAAAFFAAGGGAVTASFFSGALAAGAFVSSISRDEYERLTVGPSGDVLAASS